jgi:hypothetical protein
VAVAVEAREPGVYAAMLQQVEQRAQAEERERRLVAEPRLVAVE